MFGKDAEYEPFEKTLTPGQIQEIEFSLKQRLPEADRYPTIYLVKKWLPGVSGSQTVRELHIWRAAYAYYGEQRLSVFAVALGSHGALRAVQPVKVYGDQRLAKPEYLKQFIGKSYPTLDGVVPPEGAEAENAALVASVRRAILIMEAALPLDSIKEK